MTWSTSLTKLYKQNSANRFLRYAHEAGDFLDYRINGNLRLTRKVGNDRCTCHTVSYCFRSIFFQLWRYEVGARGSLPGRARFNREQIFRRCHTTSSRRHRDVVLTMTQERFGEMWRAARSCKQLGVYNEGCLQPAEAVLISFYF